MLKTIEEPPPRTIVMLVTAQPDDLLPTIRSRCQRIDFDPVADDVLRAALERDGVDARDGGDRGRALGWPARPRPRASPARSRRCARSFAEAPSRVDGTGATRSRSPSISAAPSTSAAEAVDQRHEEELEDFDAELERLGYSDRDARACCAAGSRSASSARRAGPASICSSKA